MTVIKFPPRTPAAIRPAAPAPQEKRPTSTAKTKARAKLAAAPRPPAPLAATANLWSTLLNGRDSLDVDLSSVIICKDDPDHPETKGTIVWARESEAQIRNLCARFHFERIPFTLDELDALDRYLVEMVDAKALLLSQSPLVQGFMLKAKRKNLGKYIPAYLEGIMAFLVDDAEGMKAAHKGDYIYAAIVEFDQEETRLGQ